MMHVTHTRRWLAMIIAAAVALLAVVVSPAPARADSPGTVFASAGVDEELGSNRLIRLAHSGTANGTLLGTNEATQWSGSAEDYVIRQSSDDGRSWSTLATVSDPETGGTHPWNRMWQPSLFEFPQSIGGYPAGTLYLAGVTEDQARSTTHLLTWRSTDHGASWQFISLAQAGGNQDAQTGIWEPFVYVDGSGRLAIEFADERQGSAHSQFVAHIVSTDGGTTWSANSDGSTRVSPGEVQDVASATVSDRPGMPTIATLSDGRMVMAYEICGATPRRCIAYTKASTDGGATWGTGPSDLGTLAQTEGGSHIESSPYIAWVPQGGADGTLLLTGRSVGDRGALIFTNNTLGSGYWTWTPRAFTPADSTSSTAHCGFNYSSSLLPSANGRFVRVTSATKTGTNGCEERSDTADIGLLPYSADFTTGRDRGWLNFGGCWTAVAGVYSDTCGADGNKSVTGNTGWTDYTAQADVALASTGGSAMAGLNVRMNGPNSGATAQKDYFAGVTGSSIVFGRHSNNWTQLATATIPGGLAAGVWYHLTVESQGCAFRIQGTPVGSTAAPVSFSYTDSGCTQTRGAIGVQDFGGASASWRNVTVTAGSAPASAVGDYLAPFASGVAAGWSTYGGTWTVDASSGSLTNTSGGAGDKQIYTPSAAWTNYTAQADVTVPSTSTGGNAGFVVRASNPSVGADALTGYFVGLTWSGIVIGRQDGSWHPLVLQTLPGHVLGSSTYHLAVTLSGCDITATAVATSDATDAVQATAHDCTYASGAVGVRTYASQVSYRALTVTPVG